MPEKPQRLASPIYQEIADLLTAARAHVRSAVNTAMVQTYWHIGRIIVEEEQRGENKADYGTALLKDLSTRLTEDFGKGFTISNIQYFRQFYLFFPIHHSLSGKFKEPSDPLKTNDLEIRQAVPGEFKNMLSQKSHALSDEFSPPLRPELRGISPRKTKPSHATPSSPTTANSSPPNTNSSSPPRKNSPGNLKKNSQTSKGGRFEGIL